MQCWLPKTLWIHLHPQTEWCHSYAPCCYFRNSSSCGSDSCSCLSFPSSAHCCCLSIARSWLIILPCWQTTSHIVCKPRLLLCGHCWVPPKLFVPCSFCLVCLHASLSHVVDLTWPCTSMRTSRMLDCTWPPAPCTHGHSGSVLSMCNEDVSRQSWQPHVPYAMS